MNTDRLPPSAEDSEQALIGCLLYDPNEAIPLCSIKLQPNDFYDLRNRIIYESILALHDSGMPIDTLVVAQHLRSSGQQEAVGGAIYLAHLGSAAGNLSNLEYHITAIQRKAILRNIIHSCTQAIEAAFEDGQDETRIDNCSRILTNALSQHNADDDKPIRSFVIEAMKSFEADWERENTLGGLSTGLSDLDRLINGLRPSELTIIAGRPSEGKSTLAANIADHIAVTLGQPVAFFSLEMKGSQIVKRVLSSRSRINQRAFIDHTASSSDFDKVALESGKVSQSPLILKDMATITINQIRSFCRRWHRKNPLKLVVVDYLQLVQTPKAENRTLALGQISCGLKALAMELDIPVIGISQLSRAVVSDGNRIPRLSDLRESGSLEQDADNVILIHPLQDDNNPAGFHTVNLLIAKQREGPKGTVQVMFVEGYTRFENYSKVQNEDVPKPYKED